MLSACTWISAVGETRTFQPAWVVCSFAVFHHTHRRCIKENKAWMPWFHRRLRSCVDLGALRASETVYVMDDAVCGAQAKLWNVPLPSNLRGVPVERPHYPASARGALLPPARRARHPGVFARVPHRCVPIVGQETRRLPIRSPVGVEAPDWHQAPPCPDGGTARWGFAECRSSTPSRLGG